MEARLDWTAGPDVQLKQIVLGVCERRDAAVRAHVAARKVPSPKPFDPQGERIHVGRVEHDHAAARASGCLGW